MCRKCRLVIFRARRLLHCVPVGDTSGKSREISADGPSAEGGGARNGGSTGEDGGGPAPGARTEDVVAVEATWPAVRNIERMFGISIRRGRAERREGEVKCSRDGEAGRGSADGIRGYGQWREEGEAHPPCKLPLANRRFLC